MIITCAPVPWSKVDTRGSASRLRAKAQSVRVRPCRRYHGKLGNSVECPRAVIDSVNVTGCLRYEDPGSFTAYETLQTRAAATPA